MAIFGGLILTLGVAILAALLKAWIDRRDLHGVLEEGWGARALAQAGFRALLRSLGWFCVVAGIALILLAWSMAN